MKIFLNVRLFVHQFMVAAFAHRALLGSRATVPRLTELGLSTVKEEGNR